MSQQLAGVETGNPQGTSVTTGSQQQTPSVTDTPTETTTTEGTAQTPPVNTSQFSTIIKKEKQILREKRALKEQQMAFEAEKQKWADEQARLQRFKELSNPLDALKEKGWTYEDLTNYVLSGEKTPPEKLIADVKKELEDLKTAQQREKEQLILQAKEAAEKEQQQIIENFKAQTNDFIVQNKDTYELINLHDAQEVVFATVEEHWAKEVERYNKEVEEGVTQPRQPKVLSMKEACDVVEKYLEENISKSLQTKKLSTKFKPLETDTPSETNNQAQASPGEAPQGKPGAPKGIDYKSFTIHNAMSGQGGPTGPGKKLSERMMRAMAALDKRQL